MKNYYLKSLFILLLLILSNAFTDSIYAKGTDNEKNVQELKIRNGLPNFFAKIEQGDSIRVAYLGGSITAQPGWRVYSLQWMQKQYPQAKFIEINAAIGGTASDFGVFRLNDHVLKFKPDLVFVEFAVNDGRKSPEKIIRSMEGIVRQVWQANSQTDICFIYTLRDIYLETEQAGNLPATAINMEKIANKYKIPSINYGFEVVEQIKKGQLIFTNKASEVDGVKVFSSDGVHPNIQNGHVIYQEILQRSFEKMTPKGKGHPHSHKIGKPLASNNFSKARMLDYSKLELSKDWEILEISENSEFSRFGRYLNSIVKASRTGESITVRFKGESIGFFDIMGPDAGRVIVEIDGIVTDTISRFDKFCTYQRMNYFLIDNLEDENHIVVFKTLSEPFDKASIISNKDDFAANPEKYHKNNWYIGKVLINGELN